MWEPTKQQKHKAAFCPMWLHSTCKPIMAVTEKGKESLKTRRFRELSYLYSKWRSLFSDQWMIYTWKNWITSVLRISLWIFLTEIITGSVAHSFSLEKQVKSWQNWFYLTSRDKKKYTCIFNSITHNKHLQNDSCNCKLWNNMCCKEWEDREIL